MINKSYKKIIYLLASVVITYAVLTYLSDKSPHYITYAYPPAVLIIFITFFEIKNKGKKYLLIGVLSSTILINFCLTQLNYLKYWRFVLNVGNYEIGLPNYGTKYSHDVWPTKTIVSDYLDIKTCPRGVLVFPDHRFISHPNIKYLLLIKGVSNFSIPAYAFYNPAIQTNFNTNILDGHDCIITKTGEPGIFANEKVIEYVNSYLKGDHGFKLLEFKAPDNSSIFLYIRK